MIPRFLNILKNENLDKFYLHLFIWNLAGSLFDIFSSIFVYQVLLKSGLNPQTAISYTLIFLSITFLFQLIFMPLCLKLISKHGIRLSIGLGSLFYLLFISALNFSQHLLLFLILAAILWGLYAAFYWLAHHLFFVEFTRDGLQGEQIALGSNISKISSVIGPIIGAFIILNYGYSALFGLMILLILVSILPLKYIPKTLNKISISNPFKEIKLAFSVEKKNFIALLGLSVVHVATINIWPLFIFLQLLEILLVGILGTITTIVSLFSEFFVGFLTDKKGGKLILPIFSTLDSFVWVLKSFLTLPYQLFSLSAIQSFTTTGQLTTLDSSIYKESRHLGIGILILQRELGLAIFKSSFLLLSGLLVLLNIPFTLIFILIAILVLLTRFYHSRN